MSLVQCIIRQLQRQNMQVLPDSLFDVKNEKGFRDAGSSNLSAFTVPAQQAASTDFRCVFCRCLLC